MEKRYFTTTLPYVNADPHVGFALEIVHADIVVRYHARAGRDVFFNTGTDEHGQKIYDKALTEGKDPQKYVDSYAAKFKDLKDVLGLFDGIHFIRTTDERHKKAAQEFWRRCVSAGDIYKKFYRIKYCVGCELEKTDSEIENGRCPIHPNLELEVREEENYFFRLSAYRTKLREYYAHNQNFIVPAFRLEEAKRLVSEDGLDDFSISRLKTKMPWGVPVPDDPEHVMYVWFDALVNYISTLGWPASTALDAVAAGEISPFEEWWGTADRPNAVQFAGKDQVKQQAVMWQAMLMSAGLPPSKTIVIHGFITSGGQKMSKSLGNVINPLEIVREYGTDALRYYLARHIHPFEDSDFTREKFHEAYTAHLVNGVGNLTARIMKMAEMYLEEYPVIADSKPPTDDSEGKDRATAYTAALEAYDVQSAAAIVWGRIGMLDKRIQETEPFKLVKTDLEKARGIIRELVRGLSEVGYMLEPFMSETSAKILTATGANKMPEPLFPRK